MSKDHIRVLQITDTHLFQDASGSLCGQNTEASLNAVLEQARNDSWPPDLILATGDLSQDMTEASYFRFRDKFSKLGVPVYCCPGNHDLPDLMNEILKGDQVQMGRSVLWENWQFIMLSSVIPKKTGGNLDVSELQFLEDRLAAHPNSHVMICLHHSPIQVQSDWMDEMVLKNSSEFFNIVDKFPHVKAVLWGHIHQEYDGERNGVKLMGSPSTSVQFLPKSSGFGFDSSSPGYRWIHLYKDGRIETGVNRAESFKSTVDLQSNGY